MALIRTNPYLNDPVARNEMLRRSVIDSSYVEGARHVKLAANQDERAKPRRSIVSSKSQSAK